MSTARRNIGARMIMGLALGLIGGTFAFMESTSSALSDNSPALALKFNGKNEIAAQRMASSLLKNLDDQKSLQSARALTLTALNQAAGLAPSLRNYAILSEQGLMDGDPNALMQMAAKFSKRDLPTQLWLIEKEAQSGDIGKTLAAYDLAMTSNPELRAVLFPILATAVSDEELLTPIADLLKTEPQWGPGFYAYFAQDERVLANFPVLLNALSSDAQSLIPVSTRRNLANNLIKIGNWEAAYRTSSLGNISLEMSDFSNDDDRIAPPFGWSFSPSGTVGFTVNDNATLSINVGLGAGTTLASRVVRLPAANAKLQAVISSDNATLDQIPRVSVVCIDQKSSEQRFAPKSIGNNKFAISDKISQPNCRFVNVKLIVPSNFSGPAFAASIESINVDSK